MFGNHSSKQKSSWPVYSFLLFPPSTDHRLPVAPTYLHHHKQGLFLCPGLLFSFGGQGSLSVFSFWAGSGADEPRRGSGMQRKASKSPGLGTFSS